LKIHFVPVELPLHDLAYGLQLNPIYFADFFNELLRLLKFLVDEKAWGFEVEKGRDDVDHTSWQDYLVD
jgi:hypothetical protein